VDDNFPTIRRFSENLPTA